MIKTKILKITIFILLVDYALSTAKAESFDPEAISQVSKAIAEWKLMDGNKSEKDEKKVYVSSSLRGVVERDNTFGIIQGLAAFDTDDTDFMNVPEIGKWELSMGLEVSNLYINNLPNIDNPHTNPWRDAVMSTGGELTTRGIGDIYGSMGNKYNNIANIQRSLGAASANKIADSYMRLGYSPSPLGDVYRLSSGGIRVPNHAIWIREGGRYRGIARVLKYPTDTALRNATKGLRIYGSTMTVMGVGIQAVDTFLKTTDYIGTSMQIMDPPIYLQNNPELGQVAKFTPSSEKILGIPISGIWEGYGSYSIPGGSVKYEETFQTTGPGPITKSHTDWINSDIGTYYRHTEIKTPVINKFERFAPTRYPLGSGYWNPTTSTSSTVTRIQQSYHVETIRGVSKITPLPNSKIGTFSYGNLGNNLYIPKTTWYVPKTTISVPKTQYYIPKASYSIPR